MSGDRDKPYIKWYVPRRRGPPRVVEISRRNWRTRAALVLAMWVLAIGFFGLVGGVELAAVMAIFALLFGGGIMYFGWQSGREEAGKQQSALSPVDCPSCGRPITDEYEFCPECGGDLAVHGIRKQEPDESGSRRVSKMVPLAGTAILVGFFWLMLVFAIVSVSWDRFDSLAYWIWFGVFASLVLFFSLGAGPRTRDMSEYLFRVKPWQAFAAILGAAIVILVLLAFLHFTESRDVREDAYAGIGTGGWAALTSIITYFALLRGRPHLYYCTRCKRYTWHRLSKQRYRCDACGRLYPIASSRT